ncbi:hypothetical protein BV25DRAFT_1325849 [Artomyces pyxidatus]|uniref:Uncharacterized protein n=1 Tax=Artomyces pyxidatus TaxID=48021 RepID=A0ACB8SQG0_9AGAM|nr:hypothetical protein BV25DRAFT_1325849 [Artomyces pyxidatus]
MHLFLRQFLILDPTFVLFLSFHTPGCPGSCALLIRHGQEHDRAEVRACAKIASVPGHWQGWQACRTRALECCHADLVTIPTCRARCCRPSCDHLTSTSTD